MGMWQLYRSLDAEQKRILREKRIDETRPVDELMALLQPVAACDAAEAGVTKWGCLSILGIVVGFILLALDSIPLTLRLVLWASLLAAASSASSSGSGRRASTYPITCAASSSHCCASSAKT